MAARKLSIAFDEAVAAAARASADRQGLSLSAWVNAASLKALAIEDGLAAVAEWEAEHGAFTPAEIAEADAVLDAMGIGRPA